MKIIGHFKDINNLSYEVLFYKFDENLDVINIDELDWIHLAENPVKIEYDTDSLFEVILSKSCVVTVYTQRYLGEYLYANNEHDIVVNINRVNYNNNTKDYDFVKCVFAGYVEPNIYAQSYNSNYDKLEIECTDALAALQYSNAYDTFIEKQEANELTFKNYINFIGLYTSQLDIRSKQNNAIWYDNSKKTDKMTDKIIFDELSIPLNIFLNDMPEDSDTNDSVLTELLQYLNLHIIQIGFDFYIFDWYSKKDKWVNISNPDDKRQKPISFKDEVQPDIDYYASASTKISLDETYNQIQVKCDLMDMDNIIESPLDEESIYSNYKGDQFYGWEYTSTEGGKSWTPAKMLYGSWQPIQQPSGEPTVNDYIFKKPSQIYSLLKQNKLSKDYNWLYMWYFRLLKSKNWIFKGTKKENYESVYKPIYNLYDIDESRWKDTKNPEWQGWLPQQVVNSHNSSKTVYKLSPFICKFGKSPNYFDNLYENPIEPAKIDWNNYIVIPVNGNGSDVPGQEFPSEKDLDPKKGNFSSIEYANYKSIAISPTDDKTTNYLVFSGKIFMQHLWNEDEHTKKIDKAWFLCQQSPTLNPGAFKQMAEVTTKDGEKKMWASQMYDFKNAVEWNDTDMTANNTTGNYLRKASDGFSIYPPSDTPFDWNGHLVYNVNSDHSDMDRIENIPILECELQIGDKYLVYYNEEWHWLTYLECPIYEDTDDTGQIKVFHQTTFSLGINPKIGDVLLGKEWELVNTVNPSMRIGDVHGMAVPVKKSDHVQGPLKFKILGPINNTWENHSYRHRTWFRKGKWTDTSKLVLPHVKTIFMKDFECKIYSDFGGHDTMEEKDLIYVSDEETKYTNKKDDITFKINTALTSEECFDNGIKNNINISNVILAGGKGFLLNIYDTISGYQKKPEELYINEYYKSYNKPKLIVETDLHNITEEQTLSIFNLGSYYINKDDTVKKFLPVGMSFSLANNITSLKLREV